MNQLFFARLRSFALAILIFSVAGCVGKNTPIQTSLPVPATPSMPTIASLTSIVEVSPTPYFTAMPTSTKPVWEIMENWTPANQIRATLIDQSGDLWTGGPGGVVHWDLDTNQPTIYAIHGKPRNTNVVALSQTPDGTIWAGTFGNGLARFDGNSWQTLTTEDGLPGNYIFSQTMTPQGELWLTTQSDTGRMEDSRFGRLDGTTWITEPGGLNTRIVALADGSIVGTFNYGFTGTSFVSQISIFDGQTWNYSDVVPDGWVDAVTVAPDGGIWFATLHSMYHYTNQSWKRITPPWVGNDFPNVSSISVSMNGVAWLGYSLKTFDIDQCGSRRSDYEEQGVYRYDGKTWTQFTTEDGLIDNKICAITIDANNNVWFGSFDKGVSRFDGNAWTSYVIP